MKFTIFFLCITLLVSAFPFWNKPNLNFFVSFFIREQLFFCLFFLQHFHFLTNICADKKRKGLIVCFPVCRNWELYLWVLWEAVQVFQPVPGACCSSHSNKWASINILTLVCFIHVYPLINSAFSTGTFDIKASRIQECGSVDMSKYGHSQTAKIKSKLLFWLFFLLLLFFVPRLQSVARTVETIKILQIFICLHCCFNHIFLIFLSVGASLMPPPPLSSQKLSAIKNYLKHDTRTIEVGQKDGMKSRIKPIFKCNSNFWMFFPMAFSVMDLHAAD